LVSAATGWSDEADGVGDVTIASSRIISVMSIDAPPVRVRVAD
jgi:hypothetical protein